MSVGVLAASHLSVVHTLCFKPLACSPSSSWISSASSNHMVAETQQITSEPS